MHRLLRFETDDGMGEATQFENGGWDISWPYGSFRWYGSVADIKREIIKRCKQYGFVDRPRFL